MLLKNAEVYAKDFEPVKADVLIENEKIKDIGSNACADSEVYDLEGYTVIPGLIDMHIHGCGGADTGDATPEALETMSSSLVKKGITSFCPDVYKRQYIYFQ